MRKFVVATVALISASLIGGSTLLASEEHEHGEDENDEVSVKGEVIDMVCYIDHGASGAKHADCAKKCISSGLPVGLKGEDGKTYLLVGEHKPLNEQLAGMAAKTVTVRGKVASRDGFNMIENA